VEFVHIQNAFLMLLLEHNGLDHSSIVDQQHRANAATADDSKHTVTLDMSRGNKSCLWEQQHAAL
jgi:hypothetical protein